MGQTVGEIDLGLNVNQSVFNKQIAGIAKSAQAPVMNAFKPIGKQLAGIAKSAQAPVMNAFKPLGKLIGSALAVGAIAKFTKECLDLGSDLTEVQNVVDTTFKTMNSAVNDFAMNAMKTYGMSETLAKQYIGTLGAMSKSMGFSEQASYDMATAVTGLTGDVASFYNLSTDEAFDKLKSIWTGETETLKSIGVLLTQTNLDQYALNSGFGKTTANMTEQQKVMLRYQYTMSALADAQGDFSKTSGSWANQTRILTLQFEALKATLGQGFINLFTPIIQMVNSLIGRLQVLANRFKAFTELFMGDSSGGGSGIAGIASDATNAAAGLDGVSDSAKAAAKACGLLSIDELNVISDTGSSDAGSASAGTESADTGVGAIDQTQVETARGLIYDLLDAAETVGKYFKEKFGANITTAFDRIGKPLWKVRNIFREVFADCKNLAEPLTTWLNGDFTAFTQTAIDSTGIIVSRLLDTFSTVFADIWDCSVYPFLTKMLEDGLPRMTQFATGSTEALTEMVVQTDDLFNQAWSEGAVPAMEQLTTIWMDCMDSLGACWDTYGQPAMNGLKDAFTNTGTVLSSVWTNIIKPVWDNFMVVIDAFWQNHLKPMVDECLSFIGELITGASSIYNEFICPLVNMLSEVLAPVITNVFNRVVAVMSTIWGITTDVFTGFVKRIKGIVEFITGVFTGDWEKAWQGIKDIFQGTWDMIGSVLKGAINLIITTINGMISGVVAGVNTLIRALNKLQIDVPDWITDLTGMETFGFHLEEITAPQIPMLAQGGYVGANQPQLAVIGDNKREGEIVSPESKLLDMAVRAAELANGGSNLSTELLMTIIELLGRIITILEGLDLDIELDGRSLLQSLRDSQAKLGHQF